MEEPDNGSDAGTPTSLRASLFSESGAAGLSCLSPGPRFFSSSDIQTKVTTTAWTPRLCLVLAAADPRHEYKCRRGRQLVWRNDVNDWLRLFCRLRANAEGDAVSSSLRRYDSGSSSGKLHANGAASYDISAGASSAAPAASEARPAIAQSLQQVLIAVDRACSCTLRLACSFLLLVLMKWQLCAVAGRQPSAQQRQNGDTFSCRSSD